MLHFLYLSYSIGTCFLKTEPWCDLDISAPAKSWIARSMSTARSQLLLLRWFPNFWLIISMIRSKLFVYCMKIKNSVDTWYSVHRVKEAFKNNLVRGTFFLFCSPTIWKRMLRAELREIGAKRELRIILEIPPINERNEGWFRKSHQPTSWLMWF